MNDCMDDLVLVEKTLEGDLESFSQLVEKYEGRIYRLAFGVLKQREDAEDIAQETFIHAFRALATFRREAAFYTWLYRIALNRALNRRSHHWLVKAHFSTERDNAAGILAATERICPRPPPPLALEYKQALQTVERILAEMPEKFADALILRVMEGLSYAEISSLRTMSVNTVRTRIYRARQFISRRMKEWPSQHGAADCLPK
ncbi:RNA polymerase sigma factor [Massilia sp. PWRC2]|uniref:RNA polymerase sigma factor n=1 Tax=Massilia sp. PWRC2 TaxID=2804626 RepID=UPI003CF8619F